MKNNIWKICKKEEINSKLEFSRVFAIGNHVFAIDGHIIGFVKTRFFSPILKVFKPKFWAVEKTISDTVNICEIIPEEQNTETDKKWNELTGTIINPISEENYSSISFSLDTLLKLRNIFDKDGITVYFPKNKDKICYATQYDSDNLGVLMMLAKPEKNFEKVNSLISEVKKSLEGEK